MDKFIFWIILEIALGIMVMVLIILLLVTFDTTVIAASLITAALAFGVGLSEGKRQETHRAREKEERRT